MSSIFIRYHHQKMFNVDHYHHHHHHLYGLRNQKKRILLLHICSNEFDYHFHYIEMMIRKTKHNVRYKHHMIFLKIFFCFSQRTNKILIMFQFHRNLNDGKNLCYKIILGKKIWTNLTQGGKNQLTNFFLLTFFFKG